MTLTEIIESFKTKLDPSKIMNSLEKAASFNDESENDSEGNDSREDLKINPYNNSGNDSTKSSNAIRISKNEEDPLIKLTDVWKIYEMGEVEFAALKGINLEIYKGEFLV
ncbi:ABC transporter ATP-binding protein, partial [Methanosarcina sp. Z-7115]|nr:ABC transporter ATP-binding protein [Methanosarcina sp. Z-7115]